MKYDIGMVHDNMRRRIGNKDPVGITDEEKQIVQADFMRRLEILKGDYSMVEFAEIVGLKYGIVFNYMSGRRFPTGCYLKRIAQRCGVSVDWLLGMEQ